MGLIQKIFTVLLFMGSLLVVGCVKFDDPPVNESDLVIIEADCSSELTDNQIDVVTWNGVVLDPVFCDSTELLNEVVYGYPDYGYVQISFAEPLVQSGTFEFVVGVPAVGQAHLKLRLYDFFTSPTYKSASGTLYVEVNDDGSTILEWCDVVCQISLFNNNTLSTSGRLILD